MRAFHTKNPGLTALALLTCLAIPQAAAAADLAPSEAATRSAGASEHRLGRADFSGEAASPDARRVADWVVASRDNKGLPFLIVDKAQARLFLFDAGGTLGGGAPVLLGLARGDDSPPGVGDRKLSAISPAERITPAGRFVAELGRNLLGQDILWVDYDSAISLHRVTDAKPGLNPANSRLARLASATTRDNRVSHGCINVPVSFYESRIRSAFAGTNGIVYVLPETRPIREVFPIPS